MLFYVWSCSVWYMYYIHTYIHIYMCVYPYSIFHPYVIMFVYSLPTMWLVVWGRKVSIGGRGRDWRVGVGVGVGGCGVLNLRVHWWGFGRWWSGFRHWFFCLGWGKSLACDTVANTLHYTILQTILCIPWRHFPTYTQDLCSSCTHGKHAYKQQ